MSTKAALPSSEPDFPLGEREFVALMAMGVSMHALSIDMMLPALGAIAADLGTQDPNDLQLVIGYYLTGAALGSLLPGSIADRFGRRPVLFGTFAAYIILMLACALMQSFSALVWARAIQGFVCGGLLVLPAAIIRDRFDGDRMARLQSLTAVVFLTVPMLAPALGQFVLDIAGWRWIFGAMAALAALVATWAWFRLPETLQPENRSRIHPGDIARSMGSVVTSRESIGYVLGSGLTMSIIWAYINSANQLLYQTYDAGDLFPVVFGAIVAGMVVTNLVNARIVGIFGARRVSHATLFAFIANAMVMVWLAFRPQTTLWEFAACMAVCVGLLGFLGANFTSIAMQPFRRGAGAASSVQTFIRMLFAAVVGIAVGQAYDGTARPLALWMLTASLLVLLLILFSERGKLFQRRNPPGTPREPPATP